MVNTVVVLMTVHADVIKSRCLLLLVLLYNNYY